MKKKFPPLKKLRKGWEKYTKEVPEALGKLEKMNPKNLPPLLR